MDFLDEFKVVEGREIEKLSRKVLSGNCASMEDYKAACAEIKAHQRAIDNCRKTIETFFSEEKEDSFD